MSEDELIREIQRHVNALIKAFERTFGRELNVTIQVVRKHS